MEALNKRCFLSIDPPIEVIKEIARIQEQINKIKYIGKTIELENLHITLKFIGEINEKIELELKDKLKTLKFEKLKLILERIEIFNKGKNEKIINIKLNRHLFNLHEQIDRLLEEIIPKSEKFTPHITIARIKYMADEKYKSEYFRKLSVKPIEFLTNEIHLKQSILKITGPEYKTIESYQSIKLNN